MKRHTHSADPSHWNFSGFHLDLNKTELKTTSDFGGRVYIHHGNDKLGTKDTDWRTSNVNIADAKFFPAIYTTETGESTGEPKPEHDIIPIMIYIGGERPEAN